MKMWRSPKLAMDTDREQYLRMAEAHQSEAKRRGAQFFNYAQTQTDNEIGSKTSKGYLVTKMQGDKFSHQWS